MNSGIYRTVQITRQLVREYLVKASVGLSESIDIDELTNYIHSTSKNEDTLHNLLLYMGKTAETYLTQHPDYNKMAAYFMIEILHNKCPRTFSEAMTILYDNHNNGKRRPLISDNLYACVKRYEDEINNMIDVSKDYNFDFFALQTMEMSYLMFVYDKNMKKMTVETPQYMFMRVSLGIWGDNIEKAFNTYNLMSSKQIIHATPTLYNSGTCIPQMASCFLLTMGDSLDEQFDTLKDMAECSSRSGGIGVSISKVRSKDALISSTLSTSKGAGSMCKSLISAVANYVSQKKRSGSIATYFSPEHPEVKQLTAMRTNKGNEDEKARDLFLALWMPDLFFKRLAIKNSKWSLFCPNDCPKLFTTYGDEYEKLYEKYEKEGRYKEQIDTIELWYHILRCCTESGQPYILSKDACNKKSNQKNVGYIECSNLCAEIVQYSSKDEIATCNLAAVSLHSFLNADGTYNYKNLGQCVETLVDNVNRIIDINFYPNEKTRRSNLKLRPMAIGVFSFAVLLKKMKIPFESEEAKIINKKIFETIYYHALKKSCELAKLEGAYECFNGSPFSQGKLQFHLWGIDKLESEYDWDSLIDDIKEYGTRNSLLTAVQPTCSVSSIVDGASGSESIEPFTSNFYVRKTQSGEYTIVNEYLVRELIELNLWNDDMRKKIIYYNGSIQNILEIPENIRELHKTAYEINMRHVIKMSADRGIFIDQSQSLNLYFGKPDYKIISSALFYGWKMGLKTMMYYCRSQAATTADKFSFEVSEIEKIKGENAPLAIKDNIIVKNEILDNMVREGNYGAHIDVSREEVPVKYCPRRKKGDTSAVCEACT